MTGAPWLRLTVARGDLRAALLAALPHAPADADLPHSRVRLTLTAEDVPLPDLSTSDVAVSQQRHVLLVSACDGYTGGVARVEVHGVDLDESPPAHPSGRWSEVDLPVESVQDVLNVFTPPAKRDERAVWATEGLQLEATASEVTWEEHGSFVDGKSLRVPRLAPIPPDSTDYPDLPRTVVDYLETAHAVAHPAYVNPGLLSRFVRSAKAFGNYEVVLRHVYAPRGIVVHVGATYVGVLLTLNERTEDEAGRRGDRLDRWSTGWSRRLGPVRRPEPVPQPPADVVDLAADARALAAALRGEDGEQGATVLSFSSGRRWDA